MRAWNRDIWILRGSGRNGLGIWLAICLHLVFLEKQNGYERVLAGTVAKSGVGPFARVA